MSKQIHFSPFLTSFFPAPAAAPAAESRPASPLLPPVGTLVTGPCGHGKVCGHITVAPGFQHKMLVEVLYYAQDLPPNVLGVGVRRPGQTWKMGHAPGKLSW